MRVVTITSILKTECDGRRSWVGWVKEGVEIPQGVQTATLDALDLEDGSNELWLLAFPTAVTLFNEDDVTRLRDGESRRCALAKLTDADLEAIGLSRE
jgi:hypothetical protein